MSVSVLYYYTLITVQSLEKAPQEIFDHIDRIGCYHAHLKRYGFKAAMWDKLGVCLIDGIVVQDCLRGFPDACRAWTIMVAALIDRLRSAPRNLSVVPLVNFRFRSRPLLVPPGSCNQIDPVATTVEKQPVKFSLGCPAIADRSPLPMPLPKLQIQPAKAKVVNQQSQSACLAAKTLPVPMNLANAMAILGQKYQQQRKSDGELLKSCNQRSHSHQRFNWSDETNEKAFNEKKKSNNDLRCNSNNNSKRFLAFNGQPAEIRQNSISQQNFFSSQTTFV
uniref:Uncharacterized protein n=1 Tax=Ditylenchus dipsaci TaxID=166011 RepID=A0A915CLA6_9BILA